MMEELLRKLSAGDAFSLKEIERALGRLNWATSSCPLSKPFLQPLWAWKSAVIHYVGTILSSPMMFTHELGTGFILVGRTCPENLRCWA